MWQGRKANVIKGFITTRHILLHPITLISSWGVKNYLKMLLKCLDNSSHLFTDFFML